MRCGRSAARKEKPLREKSRTREVRSPACSRARVAKVSKESIWQE
jgi:hypothetical protein